MQHLETAQLWVRELEHSGPEKAWSAVRSAVVATPLSELPTVLASVRWFIEVGCLANPQHQQKFDDWLQRETSGANLGPPSQLAEQMKQREQRTPTFSGPALELRNLVRQTETLNDQLDRLKSGIAEFQGES